MADFDDDDSPQQQQQHQPITRRRPGRGGAPADENEDEDNGGDANNAAGGGAPVPQSRPPMKSWGDAPPSSTGATKSAGGETSSVSENMNDNNAEQGKQQQTAFGRRAAGGNQRTGGGALTKDKYDSDQITDITEIPDLEEDQREVDITTTVADAPNVRSNRVQGLQELDSQILFQLPSAMQDGIDLSLLMSSLSPQMNVSEPDQLWEFEQLFADVSSEMLAETEPIEKEDGEDDEPDESKGVAKGDGKKAVGALRDRGGKVEIEMK